VKDALIAGMKKTLQRYERYDDKAIAKVWVEIARRERRVSVSTHKGLSLEVRRKAERNKVTYEGFVANVRERVAWMHTMAPSGGRVQITNANVYAVDDVDYRRHGIGTAIYDLIEEDVQNAGGERLEPHWGSMNEEAISFWENRQPAYAGKLEQMNLLGPPASGLFE
jgi:hypothetical protein